MVLQRRQALLPELPQAPQEAEALLRIAGEERRRLPAVSAGDLSTLIGLGQKTIGDISSLGTVLVPVLAQAPQEAEALLRIAGEERRRLRRSPLQLRRQFRRPGPPAQQAGRQQSRVLRAVAELLLGFFG